MFSAIYDVLGDDLALRVAAGCGVLALVVTFGLVLQVLVLRLRSLRQRGRWLRCVARWRPLLLRVAAGDKVTPPTLAAAEVEQVMMLWNQIQESLRGGAHEALNGLGRVIDLPRHAREALQHPDLRRQLLGIGILAHLGRREDEAEVRVRLDDRRAVISLAAARALLRMEPARWVPEVIERFLQRPDWSLARLATMLQETGAVYVSSPLAERLGRATPAEQLRLLPLAPLMETITQARVIDTILRDATHPSVLAEALPQVRGPSALEAVRRLTFHEQWPVRAQAALALGRVGEREDRRQLVTLLSDAQWWVRYRAAWALTSLPGMDTVDVVALCASLQDRYARDILAHVAAERTVVARRR